MEVQRRLFLQLAAGMVAVPAVTRTAGAQEYPTRPVRLLVGFAPGGPNDIVARLVGEKLSEVWGRPVVIDNVTGASGNLATDRAAKAAPDGHTLLMAAAAPIVANLSLYQKMTFDPIKDLAPISLTASGPNVLVVHNDVPAKSVRDLVTIARESLHLPRVVLEPAIILPANFLNRWLALISNTSLTGAWPWQYPTCLREE